MVPIIVGGDFISGCHVNAELVTSSRSWCKPRGGYRLPPRCNQTNGIPACENVNEREFLSETSVITGDLCRVE